MQRPALLAARLALAAAGRAQFGHAAAAQTVHGVLAQLDRAGITGELALREVREGRVEVVPMWGRPESVRAASLPAAGRNSLVRPAESAGTASRAAVAGSASLAVYTPGALGTDCN